MSRTNHLRRSGIEPQPGPTEKAVDVCGAIERPAYIPSAKNKTKKRDYEQAPQYQCTKCMWKGNMGNHRNRPGCGTGTNIEMCSLLPFYNVLEDAKIADRMWTSEEEVLTLTNRRNPTERRSALRQKTEVERNSKGNEEAKPGSSKDKEGDFDFLQTRYIYIL